MGFEAFESNTIVVYDYYINTIIVKFISECENAHNKHSVIIAKTLNIWGLIYEKLENWCRKLVSANINEIVNPIKNRTIDKDIKFTCIASEDKEEVVLNKDLWSYLKRKYNK